MYYSSGGMSGLFIGGLLRWANNIGAHLYSKRIISHTNGILLMNTNRQTSPKTAIAPFIIITSLFFLATCLCTSRLLSPETL